MTNEEAIKYIIRHCNPDYPKGKTEWETAINMAINALKAQLSNTSEIPNSSDDLINRQAAIDAQGEKMNRQRKVVITTTYNELGIIVDTKAEELDLSVQPNLQPTCNNLATDTISRQAAIDAIKTSRYLVDAMEKIIRLPPHSQKS